MPEIFIEQPEENDQPVEKKDRIERVVESVAAGAKYFSVGMIVRNQTGQLAEISGVSLEADTTDYGPEDRSVRRPKVQTNPVLTLKYPDGREEITRSIPTPIYIDLRKLSPEEIETYVGQTSFELRGHRYTIGERVSFRKSVGPIVMIYPGGDRVGVVANVEHDKVKHGRSLPMSVWEVPIEEIDYLEYEGSFIRRNEDKTIYKPTLKK